MPMYGDYNQTDKVSHGYFLRHCSWARISVFFAIDVIRVEGGGYQDLS